MLSLNNNEYCNQRMLSWRIVYIAKGCKGRFIAGDFQVIATQQDLSCLGAPLNYRLLRDFHEYYSGQKIAPVLTIFVGGNNEASNY